MLGYTAIRILAEQSGFFFNKYDMIVGGEDGEIAPEVLFRFAVALENAVHEEVQWGQK